MNRTHLLSLARQSAYANLYALALAEQVQTAGDVQSAAEHQSELASRLGRQADIFFRTGIGLALVFSAAVLLLAFGSGVDPMWCATAIAASLVGMLVSAWFCISSAGRRLGAEEQLELLAPVVNSAACQSAIEYIDAGDPEVLAWRDIAIAERDVLCAFDVHILRDIHYALLAARNAAATRSAQEAACRRLYDIAAPAPACA